MSIIDNFSKFRLLIVASLILVTSIVMGQKRDASELSNPKKHKLANNLITSGSYYSAIDHLKELVQKDPNNEKYIFRLADAYYYSRDYRNAEIWYGKLVKMEKKASVALYQYAQCLKYNAKYKEAKEAFKKFSVAKLQENSAAKFKPFAKNEVLSCEWAINNTDTSQWISVDHIGDNVNSKYSEFGPVLMNDTTLVFSSLQSDTVIVVDADEPHIHQVKLLASRKENAEWGIHEVLPNVNSTFENNANGTFSSDGKRFYFTRCIPDERNVMICSVYLSEVVDGEFKAPEKLNEKININGYTSTQPNIGVIGSANKQYEVLFFASNRPGGRGGMDIWYCTINKDGSLKTAANAGSVINTPGDEITPYLHKESGHLYFSSNYHFGYGGYDVFKCTGSIGKWSKPVNMKKPVNSRVDDTYYTLLSSWRDGFVVSNRPEGYHLTSETCCDDIYSLDIKIPLVLTAEAFSLKDTTQAVDAKFLIVAKPRVGTLDLYSDKDTLIHEADSLLRVEHHTGLFNYLQKKSHSISQPDSLFTSESYPEVQNFTKYYEVLNRNDYVVFGMGKYDTSVFVFRSKPSTHELATVTSTDSLTNYSLLEGNTVDILKIRFYLDADSIKPIQIPVEIVKVDTVQQVLEDEKTLTVTKFAEDIKSNKRKGVRLILNYDFDDEQFIKSHAPSLDSLADIMHQYPDVRIEISSHTDDKGTIDYNVDLSKRRARSIEVYLHRKGIEKKRMVSTWHGESQPMVPNSNPDGSDNPLNRHYNRRSEITVLNYE